MYSKDTHDFNISVHQMSPEMIQELKSDRFRVVIFGSARIKPEEQDYKDIVELAKKIGHAGHDIVTGGGPGIMEAANFGHKLGTPEKDNPARSIGLNIRLPMEQAENKNLDIMDMHDRFSSRLDEFMMLSNMVIVAPGGIGTLLELFYTWQLLQVKHVCEMPIVLVGDMWRGLIDWVRREPLAKKYLNVEDMNFVIHADTCDQAFEIVQKTYHEHLNAGKVAQSIEHDILSSVA